MQNRYQVTLDTASSILNRIDEFTEGFIKYNSDSLSTPEQQNRVRQLIKIHIDISFSLTDDVGQELLIFNKDHQAGIHFLIRNSIIKEIFLILKGAKQVIDNANKLGCTLFERLLEVLSDIQELADGLNLVLERKKV